METEKLTVKETLVGLVIGITGLTVLAIMINSCYNNYSINYEYQEPICDTDISCRGLL